MEESGEIPGLKASHSGLFALDADDFVIEDSGEIEIQDIVITKMKILGDPPLPKIYNVYVYVNNQLDKYRELEIARTIYSFIEDNFFIKVRNIEFDSEDFLYKGNPIRINHLKHDPLI